MLRTISYGRKMRGQAAPSVLRFLETQREEFAPNIRGEIMKKMLAACLACSALLTGCANGFADFYHGMTKEQVDVEVGSRPKAEPRPIYTNDVKGESEHLAENGYALVGESAFQGRQTRRDESSALTQAKAIGADVVVLSERGAGSETVSVPLTTPTTSTSYSSFNGSAFNPGYGTTNVMGSATTTSFGTSTTYVPMTVRRADYYAGYWVKAKPPIIGVNVSPLSADQHRQIGTNSGVLVRVVVIGSPAFKADIFKGDYLMAIGGDPIASIDDFKGAARAHAGTLVDVQLLRDGQRITKQVRLADAPK